MPRDLTCREAARLLFGAAEVEPSGIDREALEAHIAECEACCRVRVQVDFMNSAQALWRRYRDDPSS